MQDLYYVSTRGEAEPVLASEAILQGICKDGGLFVPSAIPKPDKPLKQLCEMRYEELAFALMKLYFTDFTQEELKQCIAGAYQTEGNFDTEEIAPLVKKGEAYFLELFHGRTLAFKDMALSILPYLMKVSAKKHSVDKEIVILTATSGDTGKAALAGFAEVEGTKIIVFFPEDGVSPVQKLQMTTQEGSNTFVAGIKGNFDDAQTAVKEAFTDEALRKTMLDKGYLFSSANSINIGRLVPQIVYYFYAYGRLLARGDIKCGEEIHFTVPTGNFGNILAGYYAKCMGLPIKHLICASNDNKVLYDFFKTGCYDKNRAFIVTASPSMDILISSNLERLLNQCAGAQKTKECMQNLREKGRYEMAIKEPAFIGEFASQDETVDAIRTVYADSGYIMDTHTAVAYAAWSKYTYETHDDTKNVIVSTASPYKFAKDVLCALDAVYEKEDVFALMPQMERLSKVAIPAPIQGIDKKEVRHKTVCEKKGIRAYIERILFEA